MSAERLNTAVPDSSSNGLATIVRLIWGGANWYVRARLATALALVIAASILTALGPVVLKHLVDQLTGAASETPIPLPFWVVAYALILWLARIAGEGRGFVYARAERRLLRRLSERMFGHLLRLPLRFHLNRQTGSSAM